MDLAASAFLSEEPLAFKSNERTRFADYFLTAEDKFDRDVVISDSFADFKKTMAEWISEQARLVREPERLGFITDAEIEAVEDNLGALKIFFGPLTETLHYPGGTSEVVKSKVMRAFDIIASSANIDLELASVETAARDFGRALIHLDDKQALTKRRALPDFVLTNNQRELLQSTNSAEQVLALSVALGLLNRAITTQQAQASDIGADFA